MRVARWLKSPLRWLSLLGAGVAAYALGVKRVVLLLPAAMIASLAIEIWVIECIRMIGRQIPMQMSEPDGITRLLSHEGLTLDESQRSSASSRAWSMRTGGHACSSSAAPVHGASL